MKFKVGDRVLVTAGKDKGKKSVIIATYPKQDKVVVKDVNVYVKHVKPFMDRAGEKKKAERPMSVAKIAILNDKDQADRIAYKRDEAGKRFRFFKKAKTEIKEQSVKEAKKETKKVANKASKKTTKKTEKKK
jgi:large subunit ribosomal protein L24